MEAGSRPSVHSVGTVVSLKLGPLDYCPGLSASLPECLKFCLCSCVYLPVCMTGRLIFALNPWCMTLAEVHLPRWPPYDCVCPFV